MTSKSVFEQGNSFMVKNDWLVPDGFHIKCSHDVTSSEISWQYRTTKNTVDLFAGDVLVGRWQGKKISIWASDIAARDMVRTILVSLAERANEAWKELNERREQKSVLAQIKHGKKANAAVKAAMTRHQETGK